MVSAAVAECLRRIAESDAEIRAWVEVNPQPATGDGPLNGIPFGAKDIFETRSMATEYGSALYAGQKGVRDAAVISTLRSRGAILLGKTHTTAFASFDPAPTRNPRFPDRTPGGSSSGSAAAVAAGMAAFALGTQTLGSVLRPASYCGVCGFKPTFGLLSTDGVLPFAPSLDTVGLFTRSAADMAWLWPRSFGSSSDGRFRDLVYFRSEPGVADAVRRLRQQGVTVSELDPPSGWDRLLAAAYLINEYEGARTHSARYQEFGDRIGIRLAALVRRGLAIGEHEYRAALAHVGRMRGEIASIFRDYQAILSPSATGPAPAGLDSTGDPANNACWTALGVPAISVPYERGVGLQITAPWDRDDALVAAAAQVEALLG